MTSYSFAISSMMGGIFGTRKRWFAESEWEGCGGGLCWEGRRGGMRVDEAQGGGVMALAMGDRPPSSRVSGDDNLLAANL
jgi:hypothetical protein